MTNQPDKHSRSILPIPDRAYAGLVKYDAKDPESKFPPLEPLRPPAGAPNVLIVLIDDAGFASSSAFGGPIHTPAAERLAAEGLKYNRFHTTALCSPTRSALLTGRNHHTVGMGGITELATSAPGYTSIWPDSCAPLAMTLKLNGYSTAQFGKCHEVPVWETSPMGPFRQWPSGGGGFEYFYGFIGGEANQWYPALYEGTTPVEAAKTPEEGYHLTEDMADKAINWARQQKALMPDKPFFIYFAPGATHAPHHVPQEWSDKYKGKFDLGWDTLREEIFAALDPTPIASASLAQVYPAMLADGTHVVLKVQRPGVERTVDTDLDILLDIARLVRDRLPGVTPFNPVELAEEFAIALHEELDYQREGRNADRFRENFAEEEHLYVPRVYWEFTTQRLMVQERIRGIKIDDLESLDAAGYDRDRIALHAARLVIKEVLEDGFFHADPHPGNLIILPGETLGIIDFGTVGYLDERDKANLIRLYIAIIRFDATAIVDQLIRMGVAEPSVDGIGLERDMRRLLRRYKGLPLKDISATELLSEIQPIIYEYQLRVPSDYWLLIKTLVLMEGVGKKVAPQFDVFAVSEPYVRRFLLRLALPTSWGPEALRSLGGWAAFINDLPGQTSRLMGRMERGQLEIRIKDPATENQTRQLNQVANRVIQAILLGSLTIGLALLLPNLDLIWPWGLLTWAAILGFGAVVVLALWLLWSIWRSGRGL